MGQYFQFINFDKHQAHEPPMRKFGEFGGNSIIKNLMAFAPDAKLDTALKKIFPGYDLSKALSYSRAELGYLGKFPVELIGLIFDATDLDGAAMLCITHAQLFATGYSATLAKARTIALSNNWAYDRIICIGDYSDTLPVGFLSPEERQGLMEWGIARDAGVNGEEEDAQLKVDCGTADSEADSAERERERDEALAAYKDQSFHLYQYGMEMPTLYQLSREEKLLTALEWKRIEKLNSSPMDDKRLRRAATLMHFNPYDPRTPHNWYNCAPRTAMLINVTKREFVPAMDERGQWVLDIAIPVLTVWGHDDGYPGDMMKGKWAGDRLAIVSAERLEERMKEEDGWMERKERWATEPACQIYYSIAPYVFDSYTIFLTTPLPKRAIQHATG